MKRLKVKKFPKPIRITLGDPNMGPTYISSGTSRSFNFFPYKFSLFKQFHIFSNSGLIQIFKHRNFPWAGMYLQYGVRKSNVIQIIPICFSRNNSSISFGLGFYKAFIGITFSYVTTPNIFKNKSIYYYGNLW